MTFTIFLQRLEADSQQQKQIRRLVGHSSGAAYPYDSAADPRPHFGFGKERQRGDGGCFQIKK